jgi:phosphoglycolate phosphatase-like HAD superfamily hydrolase
MLDPTRIQAVLFDIDGTLADTDDDQIERLMRFLHPVRFLFPQPELRPFLRRWLMASEELGNRLLAIPDRLGLLEMAAYLVRWFPRGRRGDRKPHNLLMNGIPALLAGLAPRYRLGLVTSRPKASAEAFLDEFQLRGYFCCRITGLAAGHLKPHPAPVLASASLLGLPASACLMVGDSVVDILAGRRAGAQTAGVLCGFGTRAALEHAGADAILDCTKDLAGVLGVS